MSYNSVLLNSAFAVYKLAPGQEILPHVAKGHGKEERFEKKSNFITMLLFSQIITSIRKLTRIEIVYEPLRCQ